MGEGFGREIVLAARWPKRRLTSGQRREPEQKEERRRLHGRIPCRDFLTN